MNETLTWILAAAAGLVLGAIFFGGLWWTVRIGLSSLHPAVLVSWQSAAADEHCHGWILLCRAGKWLATDGMPARIYHCAIHRDHADTGNVIPQKLYH